MNYITTTYGTIPFKVFIQFRGLIYNLNLDTSRMIYECFEIQFTVEFYLTHKNQFMV